MDVARRGFTLVELISAVAVTLIMVVSIGQVFSRVSVAVQTGRATTNALSAARIIQDQLDNDFKHMLGPGAGGFLVIHHDSIQAELNPFNAQDTQRHQLDQIIFIRKRADLEPICPSSSSSFSNSSDASFCRLWLGHVRVDGKEPGDGPEMEYAAQWVLGRQALFLEGDSTGSNRAENALAVTLQKGLHDVAKVGLWNEGPSGALVGGYEHDLAVNKEQRLWMSLNGSTYADRARDLIFTNLNVRPYTITKLPTLNQSGASDVITSNEVAQMHAYFAEHVSDFAVEFAGDYEAPFGKIDTETQGGMTAIKWYGIGLKEAADKSELGSIFSDNQAPLPILRDNTIVFRHGPGSTNWPYLIRLRYRIQDERGRVTGFDGEPGIWFEQVIKVPRK